MNIAKQIRKKIDTFSKGVTFGYDDLGIAKEDYLSAAKALERLQNGGVIKKVSKGKFYKPAQSVFGELKPDYYEQLRPYLYENGKRIAYVTGTSLYNQMGLTTQVPKRIKIASRKKRIYINRGALQADAVRCYTDVNESNYKLLEVLDALKDIKQIPDSEVNSSVKLLMDYIKNLSSKQRKQLIKIALVYPPRVKALLGAIMEYLYDKVDVSLVKNDLNPLTKFQIGLKENDLSTIKNWNIQ